MSICGISSWAAEWGCQHLAKLREAGPEIPDCLYNRDQDNWRPLIAIVDEAGGHWPQTAREIAEVLNGQSEDPSEGVILLADIHRTLMRRLRIGCPRKCSSMH